ncbi:UDP-glycosyltransferase 73C6-like [Aegilops tauschii subsp. strangulata]|uniref:Glycosyltransferase n=1 Tax=Aegilops tauschii TaxID=37682 RepID=M8BL54_AEGTA
MSKHMQAAKQSLSSACLSAYIAAKQQQLHGLSMFTLSMYERRTTRLGPYMLPNTPFVFVPLMFQGHVIPAVGTALLLATHCVLASVVATPYNAARIRPTIDFARKSGLPIRLVEFPLDCVAEGLPEGADDVDKIPLGLEVNYFRALTLLTHLRTHPPYPTCIVSDFYHAWTVQVAANLKVSRLCFFSMCAFCVLCQHNVERYNSYEGVADDNEPVVGPGVERRIEVTRAQAPGILRALWFEKIADEIELALVEADGIVMNSFMEMEPEYVTGYAAARKMEVWTTGPVSLYHQHAATLANRGNTTTAIDTDESLRWLDDKEPSTVVYFSFGSIVHADPKQVVELGLGLEASGHPFVWFLKNPDQYGEDVCEFLWDLEERVAGRGMLIRGWSPQVLILNHAAVGGFVTHCGWNSTLEAIAAGLPVMTWPHFSDQFLNEKLAVEVLGIGVSVRIKEPLMWVAKKKIVVGREVVEATVRSIMDGGGKGKERRRKALSLSEKARTAVQKGGSSLGNLLDLIKHFEVDAGGCPAVQKDA